MSHLCHVIANHWVAGIGKEFLSVNPASGEKMWEGTAATKVEVEQAVQAARKATVSWAAIKVHERMAYLETFRDKLSERKEHFVHVISQDTGKPLWESRTEVEAMVTKIALSIQAYEEFSLSSRNDSAQARASVRRKPHGVVAVLGPFNLPGHLPNAHMVPALIAGNTVVFKPSELTPAVGRELAKLWLTADLPAGVFNMVQGGAETGRYLIEHLGINGVFFTGGYDAGRSIHLALAGSPEKIVALEMGGNNPLAIANVDDVDAAAYWTIQSAFITSGQRCTCARRLIVLENEKSDRFLDCLIGMMKGIRIGPYTTDPEPFMGPVISTCAADRLLGAQESLCKQGGVCLVEMNRMDGGAMLVPGLIDMTYAKQRSDDELFGPLLQVVRVQTFEQLIAEANETAYGLAAGIFSDEPAMYEKFYCGVRTGIVNWNYPLTGASGRMPFGGIGRSGNYRPSGYYAAQYCSYPIASLEQHRLAMPKNLTPGISL
tara:strand:- start:6714 stop:8180 length:1467 start_codon:yes stop_codon:yes gene_type:complete